MINLSDVVNDPDFAQSFSISRSNGSWSYSGIWQDTRTTVPMYGIIKPATAMELEQLEDGDRVKEVKSVHSSQQMFVTHDDNNSGLSDLVNYGIQQFKIVKLYNWNDFGYYKALAVRVSGA